MKKFIIISIVCFGLQQLNAQEVIESTEIEEVQIEEVVEEEEGPVKVPFAVIEEVPIFPGCEEGTKQEKKKCFTTSIQKHVLKNINNKIVTEIKLEGEKHKVYVIFVIDDIGEIKEINTRGPDKKLEEDAVRIVKLLPKMVPGKQRGRNVNVNYFLPIIYTLE